jgi:arsenite methyltransferase
MSQIEFDESTARRLEVLYGTRDVLRRRQLVRDALGVAPGERILDVGCGPGYYVAELLEEVGPEGSVVGIDSSQQMLAVAAARVEGNDNATFGEGDAVSLGVADGDFDAAICVQVLEYVPNVGAALAEIHRALRPGGRAVIWDVDWATISMHSDDPERMDQVLRASDKHLTHASLPRTLGPLLAASGFQAVAMKGHAFATTELSSDTYPGALLPIFRDFVAGREEVGEERAGAWWSEQEELAERGEFYFSVTQFCFTAERPAQGLI